MIRQLTDEERKTAWQWRTRPYSKVADPIKVRCPVCDGYRVVMDEEPDSNYNPAEAVLRRCHNCRGHGGLVVKPREPEGEKE